MFVPFTGTQGTIVHDGSGHLDSMARVQSVDNKAIFVFVSDAYAHDSGITHKA